MPTPFRDKYLTALLAAFLFVAILWSVAVPVGETPDELAHWQVLRYIRQHHSLPRYSLELGQSLQMPLYYILAAPLAADMPLPQPNVIPDHKGGIIAVDPPKLFRNYKEDLFHYAPLRILRLLSVLFAALAVWICYYTGLAATGRRSTGLLAAAIAGFLPQFAFRAGSVSNDSLSLVFAASSVFFMVKIVKQGFTQRAGLCAILSLGIGYITKAHLACLLVPWIYIILRAPAGPRDRLRRLALSGIWLLIAAGPLIRNLVLYGDPFLIRTVSRVTADSIPRSPFSDYFVTSYPHILIQSFVANFGYMNFLAPTFVYGLFSLLGLAAIAGLVMAWIRLRLDRRVAGLLALTIVSNYAFIMWVNLTFNQPQGRYLFPSLAATAILAAIGLESLPGWRAAAAAATVVVLCLLNLYLIRFVILPAYWSFPSVRQDAVDQPVGRLAGDFTIAQSFVCPCATLNRIDLYIGTYVMRNEGTVTLTLSEPGMPQPLVRSSLAAASIPNNSWVPFSLWPIENARGRRFQFELSSPDAPPGHGVAIYINSKQPLEGGQLLIRNAPTPGAVRFRAYCSDDWGGGYLLKALQVLAWKIL